MRVRSARPQPNQHAKPTLDPATRDAVAAAVEKYGAQPCARKLGVSAGGLTSYLAGTGHRGTILLVQVMAPMLAELEPPEDYAR